MSIISSENVNSIIRKTLSIINPRIIEHGEVTGYILYKMLQYEQNYSTQELLDFTMLGILHDIGLYKESNVSNIADYETNNLWSHSIYGFLFLKYLSPMEEKAEIVLYHHLDYNRYSLINSKYLSVIEYLSMADQMDAFMKKERGSEEGDYFIKYRDIKFSGKAMDLFFKAESKYQIMKNLVSGDYQKELSDLLSQKTFTEKYKRGFLEMLAYTIDFRSEHTVIHTISAVNFAEQLGRLMRLSATQLRDVYYGTLLHDIGKIAIPIEILESTGRLVDEDMRVMKAHVRITEMILEGLVSDEVLQIAARHHEKLDGTGYHKGLSEQELTLPQKIVAVADILSALYGKRSYKESFENETIKKILTEEAENHKISKEVVDCLLLSYDKVIKNYEQQKSKAIGVYLEIKKQHAETLKRFESFEA